MARKTNELTAWDAELAAIANAEASKEVTGDIIPTFSIRGGVLKINDTVMPDNKIAVVIAASVFENDYYTSAYDPEVNTPPVCYAFSEDKDTIAPIAEHVKDLQANTCAECPMNVFGSADTGRGKACSNRRKIVCIPAGEYNKKTKEWLIETDPNEFDTQMPAILSIPPTSLKELANYIKMLAKEYNRPINSVITEIKIVPDEKRQFAINFAFIDTIDKPVYDIVVGKKNDLIDALTRPYSYTEVEAPKQKAGAKTKTSGAKTKTSRR